MKGPEIAPSPQPLDQPQNPMPLGKNDLALPDPDQIGTVAGIVGIRTQGSRSNEELPRYPSGIISGDARQRAAGQRRYVRATPSPGTRPSSVRLYAGQVSYQKLARAAWMDW